MGKFNEIIKGETPTLVDFYATWCGPCKTLSPILEQLKTKKGQSLRILKIDVDKNPAIAAKLGIRGVPTLIYYKNGKQLWRKSGVIPLRELESLTK
jgi:thioredoxin 1